VVTRWRFMPPDGMPLPTMSATLSPVAARLGGAAMEKGAEMVDFYFPDMPPLFDGTIAHMKAMNMSWVQLAPPWDYTQTMPVPIIGNVVSQAQYTDQQLHDQSLYFTKAGLNVAYRVQVCCTPVPDTSSVSSAWWDAWFSTYQAFLVHHAQIAQATGVGRIVLAYPNVDFALPGMGTAAPDAEARWRAMMPAVRAAYSGRIGYDLLVVGPAGSYNLPGEWNSLKVIADLFDFWGIGLWHGYVTTNDATQQEIDAGVDATFAAAMDALYAQSPKPQILTSVAVASYDGAAINAIGNDMVLMNTYGPESANKLTYDGLEQAMVYQSLLRAVASRPYIVGFYPFNYRYVPASAAPDWSVRGKAAEGVIASWYGSF
jgi:hypothetical protein